MFSKHLLSFQKLLLKKRIPAALITAKSDIFYFTGFLSEGIALVITPHAKIIVIPEMLKSQIEKMLSVWEVWVYKSLHKTIHELLPAKKIVSLYVDKKSITFEQSERLKKIRGVRMVFSSSLVQERRIIKSEEEIKYLRKAASITARIVDKIPALFKKGRRELDIAEDMKVLFIKAGVMNAFDAIVSCGKGTSEPHHISGAARLKIPGPIMIDAGGVFKGYTADLTRTFYLGKMNEFYSQIYHLVIVAKRAAQRSIRPGVKASAVDLAAREVFKKAGLSKYFIHATGHGVGIDVHEPPVISPESKDVLQPGMVITIEPGLYFPGKFGVRIEDTMLVTKNGYEILTK